MSIFCSNVACSWRKHGCYQRSSKSFLITQSCLATYKSDLQWQRFYRETKLFQPFSTSKFKDLSFPRPESYEERSHNWQNGNHIIPEGGLLEAIYWACLRTWGYSIWTSKRKTSQHQVNIGDILFWKELAQHQRWMGPRLHHTKPYIGRNY